MYNDLAHSKRNQFLVSSLSSWKWKWRQRIFWTGIITLPDFGILVFQTFG